MNNKKIAVLPKKFSNDLAELYGILLGDGTLTKYYIQVYLNITSDKMYIPYVLQLARKLFPESPVTTFPVPHNSVNIVQISSTDVCNFFKKIGFDRKIRSIPKWIINNKEFTKATLRGIFDTEGSVGIKYFKGKNGNYFYKQVTFTNKNENILNFIEKSLELLDYKPTKNSTKNIYISNRLQIEKFAIEIGSSNPNKANKIMIQEIDGFVYGGLRRMVRHQS